MLAAGAVDDALVAAVVVGGQELAQPDAALAGLHVRTATRVVFRALLARRAVLVVVAT